ncbi:MAG: ATP-dependent zinc metalloprotease FtsH [Paludibacteraceae bacterium]|nr:ATP-dependent zinc metalloprotease FtsH [Paludibacteraceae bacterium]MBQ2065756.1 ATP-dependent zinc metalloprotease FtsH [Paludibacteraceae bacterium]MBQ5524902.1 ATP-dependent zinc metalloprotease FtsH [Paludibacteraceae bacterium]
MAEKKPGNPINNGGSGKPGGGFSLTWFYIAIAVALIFTIAYDDSAPMKEVQYSDLQEYIKDGYVDKIVVVTNTNQAEISLVDDSTVIYNVLGASDVKKYSKKPQIQSQIPSPEKLDDFVASVTEKSGQKIDIKYEERKDYASTFIWTFGPILVFIAIWIIMSRRMTGGGGIFSVGRSKAQIIDKGNKMNVTFKDVAGLSEAKQEVQEIVEFLKNPKKYTDLGGKIPKGALLVGPPGTGKTLLAKAVAGEANVPFFSLSGSDFVEMFVGVGASRVRDLFRQAKDKSPCIIFIDEIDAVGRARGKNPAFNSNDERENTLNQLLTEMDGFGTNSGIIVLAATNRADILDKALLRAGRFDRQISVDLPDVHERKEIFEVHLRPLKYAENLDIDLLAKQTPGFSGADIANVCNEAALIAARRDKKVVDRQDFTDAVDRIIGGLEKKNKITTAEEKRAIAIHEAGHASVSWLLEYANPLVKVTIVPRGKALGAAWYLPEERQLTTTEQMLDEMCALLGGRAAEQVALGRISTGALNDLERATKMAYSMVVYYGMSEKLKNISYFDSTQQDYSFTKPYSETTSEIIDQEIKSIVQSQFDRAVKIIRDNLGRHAELASILVEKEVIYADDVERIFGARPWKTRMDEITENKQ